jgi:hypothetical protein
MSSKMRNIETTSGRMRKEKTRNLGDMAADAGAVEGEADGADDPPYRTEPSLHNRDG